MARWVGRAIALLLLAGLVAVPGHPLALAERRRARHRDDHQLRRRLHGRQGRPDHRHRDAAGELPRLQARDLPVLRRRRTPTTPTSGWSRTTSRSPATASPSPSRSCARARAATATSRSASAYTTMTGEHTYVIRYSIDDALGATDDGRGRVLLEPDPGRLADADPGLPADRAPAREVRRRVSCAVGSGRDGRLHGEARGDGFVVDDRRARREHPGHRAHDRSPWPPPSATGCPGRSGSTRSSAAASSG